MPVFSVFGKIQRLYRSDTAPLQDPKEATKGSPETLKQQEIGAQSSAYRQEKVSLLLSTLAVQVSLSKTPLGGWSVVLHARWGREDKTRAMVIA